MSEFNINGITITPANNGIGEYAHSLENLININSFIADKNKLNNYYYGKKFYGIYPIITSGWAINSFLNPFYLKLKHINGIIHYLEPINHLNNKGILTIHDLYFLHRNLKREIYLKWVYKTFKNFNIIAISNITLNEFKNYTNNFKSIEVIYNSYNPIFKNLNLERKDFILTVGDGKNKRNLEICRLLDINNIEHIHIGKEVNLRHKGNKKYITNISIEKLNEYYNTAKCFIKYSSIEGFCYPVIEALATDCPVITSDIPIFNEILPDYKYKTNNLNDIIEYIKEIDKIKYDISKFNKINFDKNMRNYYKKVIKEYE